MRYAAMIAVVSVAFASCAALADEPGQDVLERLIEDRNRHNKLITSYTMRATVVSKFAANSRATEAGSHPQADHVFEDGWVNWWIDKSRHRAKREYTLHFPAVSWDNKFSFRKMHGYYTAVNSRARHFTPLATNRQWLDLNDRKALYSEVDLYDGVAMGFSIEHRELPVAWLAGGVTGEEVLSTDLAVNTPLAAMSVVGRKKIGEIDCLVVEMREGKSRKVRREFTIELAKPFRVLQCRVHGGNGKDVWSCEAKYGGNAQSSVPQGWVYTWNDAAGRPKEIHEYKVIAFQAQAEHPAETFDDRLLPGQRVYEVAHSRAAVVSPDGTLRPYSHPYSDEKPKGGGPKR